MGFDVKASFPDFAFLLLPFIQPIGKDLGFGRLDGSKDLGRLASLTIDGQEVIFDGNAEETFILLQIRQDQLPILFGEGDDLPTVKLFGHYFLMGVPDINGPTGGQRKEIGTGIGRFLRDNIPLGVNGQAVDNDKSSPLMGVSGHEGFDQKIQGGAVDDYFGPAYGIDQRASGGITQHINFTAFGPVQKGLSYIAVDHQFATIEDLPQLVLGIAVNHNFQSVDSGGQVIPAAPIGIDANPSGVRSQFATQKMPAFPGLPALFFYLTVSYSFLILILINK